MLEKVRRGQRIVSSNCKAVSIDQVSWVERVDLDYLLTPPVLSVVLLAHILVLDVKIGLDIFV